MTVLLIDDDLAGGQRSGPATGRHRGRPMASALLAVTTAALLAGCAAVPKLGPRPEPLAPGAVAAERALAPVAASSDASADASVAAVEAAWPAEGWWRAWGDPQLDALIAEGLAGSPDVAAAAARLARVGALAQQAGAARFPRLDLDAKAEEQRQSLNLYPPSFKNFLPQGWNDSGQLALNLGFDLDLWGRNRAAHAAALSERRAAALDAEEARLMLEVGIASAYADLDRLFAQEDVRSRQLDAATASRKLLAEREANGLETRGGVAASEAELANARAALNLARQELALRRHQLAALVGAGPDRGLAITRPTLAPAARRDIPAGASTELVGRRADIVAARERVEAAASRIKVARADFYPAVRLNALFGLQSLGLENLFDKDSQFGLAGPALSLPLFHGGELQGRYRGARAEYDAAVAAYNGAVLGAYRDAADALTTTRLAAARLADAHAALAASQVAYDTTLARYKGGLATYLDVLQVEDRLLQARLGAAAADAARRSAEIALIRALGGGFVPAAPQVSKEDMHG